MKKIMFVFFSLLLAVSVLAADRMITGYYYDSQAGKLLPRYDNLSPNEVISYLISLGKGYTSKTVGNNTYYYDSKGVLVQRVTLTKDANGKVTQVSTYRYAADGKTLDYIGYEYYNPATGLLTRKYQESRNEKGQTIGALNITYDSYGNVAGSQQYSGYGYYDNGTRKQYKRTDYNSSEARTAEYGYNYSQAGVLSGYIQKTYDPASGALTRDYSDSRDVNGKVAASNAITYNTSGQKTGTDAYTYTNGVVTSRALTTVDPASGTTTRNYAAGYDSAGKVASASDARYNTSGQKTYDYGYAYTNGVMTSQTSKTYDPASGTVTRDYAAAYDVNGKVAASNTVTYNTSGQKTGTDDYTYTNGVTTSRALTTVDPATGTTTRDYAAAYDANGKIASASDARYNTSGQKTDDYGYAYTNGVITAATTKAYDPASGTTTRDYAAAYDANGKIASASDERYNTSGQKTYDYGYAYTNGVMASATTKTYDPATGTTTRDYAAAYDANGKIAVSNAVSYNTSGQKTGTDDYNYTNGVTTSRALTAVDPASGTTTRDYAASYDSAGKIASVSDERYNTSGQKTYDYGYSYTNGVITSATTKAYDPASGTTTRNYAASYDSVGLVNGSTDVYYSAATGQVTVTYTASGYVYSGTTVTNYTQTRVYPSGLTQQRTYSSGTWSAWVTI